MTGIVREKILKDLFWGPNFNKSVSINLLVWLPIMYTDTYVRRITMKWGQRFRQNRGDISLLVGIYAAT